MIRFHLHGKEEFDKKTLSARCTGAKAKRNKKCTTASDTGTHMAESADRCTSQAHCRKMGVTTMDRMTIGAKCFRHGAGRPVFASRGQEQARVFQGADGIARLLSI